jgi:hypothetical protein
MLLYAVFGYLQGGELFYVFLEVFISIGSVLMMLDLDDRIDAIVLATGGAVFVIWSLMLFKGYDTVIFVIGLSILALGYTFKMRSLRRDVSLTCGSALISVFSYIGSNWIFSG